VPKSALKNIHRIQTTQILIGYLLAFATLVIFMGGFLDYDFFRGPDVRSYWEDSLSWCTPFNSFHVPAYALTIALIHSLVPQLTPVTVMMGISLAAFLCTGIIVYRIGGNLGVSDKVRYLGALLFALWPFVGLTEVVNARADLLVLALFLGGICSLLRKQLNLSALLLGLALVAHKGIWPFVLLVLAEAVLAQRIRFSTRSLLLLVFLFAPISVLWISGAIYHDSWLWILSSNLSQEIQSNSTLPVLDGLLGTFLNFTPVDLMKSAVLISVAFVAGGLAFWSWQNWKNTPYALAISAAAALLFLLLNQFEIWAALRFSRLLIIPIFYFVAGRPALNDLLHTRLWLFVGAVLLPLFLSQLAFGWYLTTIR